VPLPLVVAETGGEGGARATRNQTDPQLPLRPLPQGGRMGSQQSVSFYRSRA
jgi:hypothetical protein